MDMVKELYWNVGREVMVPMYAIVILTSVLVLFGIVKRINRYRIGQELNRSDRRRQRFISFLWNGVVQIKLMRRANGTRHMIFFWSLLVLAAGSLLLWIHEWSADLFGITLLAGDRYRIFSLVMDLAGLVGLIMLIGMMIRRCYVLKNTSKTDCMMYGLLVGVFISGFVLEGLRLASGELQMSFQDRLYSPVGAAIAIILSYLPASTILLWHKMMWWGHLILVSLSFYIVPYSRLRHIFAGAANQFFLDLNPFGHIKTLSPCDGSMAFAGAATAEQFTWKDIMDSDACVGCGECELKCPVHLSSQQLSPMALNTAIGQSAFEQTENSVIDQLTVDAVWSCTTCRLCQYVCPMEIKQPTKILEMRRHLVSERVDYADRGITRSVAQLKVYGHPFKEAHADRCEWFQGLDVVRMDMDTGRPETEIDILYFAGCFPSLNDKAKETARRFVKLCHSAGVRVGVLGNLEQCCGEPARKLGNESLYQQLATQNIRVLSNCGARHIVTTCPHCSNTLNKDYRDLWPNSITIEHYTEFLHRLLVSGRLSFKPQENSIDATYHDSCCLGRCNNIVNEPRELLKAVGVQIHEMKASAKESSCCGGGGGHVFSDRKVADRHVGHLRMSHAAEKGVDTLVVNCPICLVEMDHMSSEYGTDTIQIKDLSEMLERGIDTKL